MRPPRIHIVGRRNQGKTTFVVELVACLSKGGIRVGTIKHTGHEHPVDRPGKDSFRHRDAGGSPAALVTPTAVGAFMPRDEDPYLQLSPLYEGCDLVLVEGNLAAEGVPKLEIFRAGLEHRAPLAAERDDIHTVITDDPLQDGLRGCPRSGIVHAARLVLELARPERSVACFILSGGQSRRFGSDKARAEVEGQPLISHVATRLPLLARDLKVVAREDGQYMDLGLPTLPDEEPDLGPVGGLLTAFSSLPPGDDWVMLLPCDLWGMEQRWLAQLLDAPRDGKHAIAFKGPRWQPLPGLYHRQLTPLCRHLLESGKGALWRVLEQSDALALEMPTRWADAISVNSHQDLESIQSPGGR